MSDDPTKDTGTHALDVEPVLAIHRDHPGYVGFVRKPETPTLDKRGRPRMFENLCMVKARDLREMFPAIANWLTHDSYFTVNAYYRPQVWDNKTTGLPDVRRPETNLSHLSACYADIDCGRPESADPGERMTWTHVLAETEALMDNGDLPQASIIARSGRGIYLFWFLHDDRHPDQLPKAWPEKIQLYKAINKALHGRLRTRELPVDAVAHDAARVLRTPGSIHRKAGRRVAYWIRADVTGKGFTYTLPELADSLGIHAVDASLPESTRALAKSPKYRVVKDPGSAPLRSRGHIQLHALRAQDMLTLAQWRGGFLKKGRKHEDGHVSPGRRFLLTLYATFLHGSKAAPQDALERLREMASTMHPPYPSDIDDTPAEAILEDEYADKPHKWSNKKLCRVLGITPDMARDLELQTIVPEEVTLERDMARPHRDDLIQDRRDFARQYIETHGVPTARGLAKVYEAAGLRGANRETANQDLQALGYVVTRKRGGRPRRKPAE